MSSAAPADELLGVSDAGTHFELILGSLCAATAATLLVLHRRSIAESWSDGLRAISQAVVRRQKPQSANDKVECVDTRDYRRDSTMAVPRPHPRGNDLELVAINPGDAGMADLTTFN